MTDLTPNHPAVQVGCQAASEWVDDASADETGHITLALHMTAACITAALVLGGLAERIKFSATVLFAIIWPIRSAVAVA